MSTVNTTVLNKYQLLAVKLAERLNKLSYGIGEYIHLTLVRCGRLPARSFYGESFSAVLLGRAGLHYTDSVALLRNLYREKDKEDPDFHWEFNKYAWWQLFLNTRNEELIEFALPLRFKNTPVTNWTLLRSCTRFLAEMETDIALRESLCVLKQFQLKSGIICDEQNVRSFQYHCFSAVLVAEIYEITKEPIFLERFRRAAEFIERFVLRSGNSLYIGRGQEQSFGYGALCCLLAVAFRQFGDIRYLFALERCVTLLEGYRRPDGSFPLVMNGREVGYPLSASTSDPRFPGWYAYNNYFDYLPFFGVFLRKAADALHGVFVPPSAHISPQVDYHDKNFVIHRNTNYEAVLSRPGGGWKGGDGYWSNDLPFPYVVKNGTRVTPSYGGEQFGSALYSSAGIPLPAIVQNKKKILMRNGRIWAHFLGNRLIVISLGQVLIRQFKFLDTQIIVDDLQFGVGKIHARYLFDQIRELDERTFSIRGGFIIKFSEPMEIEDSNEYYWGGALQTLTTRKATNRSILWLNLGENA